MFIAPLKPIGKPRQTISDKWRERPVVMRYRAWADQLRAAAKAQKFYLTNGLHYLFLVPMPVSWSKKKRAEKNRSWCDQKPDLDNAIKATWDALAKEDKRIAHIGSAKKVWSISPAIIISDQPIKY